MTENEKSEQSIGERRKHRRYFVDLPVDCCFSENRAKGPIHTGITEDLGMGGVSVYLSDRVFPGNRFVVELYYRDGYRFSSLKILTEVVWADEKNEAPGYRHGLRLLKLENGGTLKLRCLLKRCPSLM
jgi:hypothetical protein